MSALDQSGDRRGALAAYDALATRLHSEFDLLPSAETQAVVAAVRSYNAARPPVLPVVAPPEVHTARETASPSATVWLYARAAMRSAVAIAVLLLGGSSPHARAHVAVPVIPREARDAYDRARFYLTKPTEENLRRAVLVFEHALDAEPLYPQAYAGLGDAYLRLGYGSYLAPSDAFPKAIAAARKAIQLDSLAPEPHATLAFAQMYFDWDFVGAEQEFKVAIRLAPEYADAHARFAYLLTAEGRVEAARREVQLARRIAPLSVAFAVDAGFVSFYGDALADARRELNEAVLMAPEVPTAHLWLGRLAQREGDFDRARAEYQATGALLEWAPTIAAAGYVEAERGNVAGARGALRHLDSLATHEYVTPYAVALLHAALGETDQAFYWLDRAVAERAHWLVWINRDSRWAPLRDDPRFATIVRRVGIPN
jgi:tetratricopeptide (TPR) repeat protein